MMMTKISAKTCIVANSGFTVINFRSELIKRLVSAGVKVFVVCPTECELMHGRNTVQELAELGATHIPVNLKRTGLNPASDLLFCYSLWRIFRKIRPDVVFNYTVKASTYGSIAAALARVEQITSNITGIGSMMAGQTLKSRLVSIVIESLYKIALRRNTVVFFQNPDDKMLFVTKGLVRENKTVVVNGSGVDTKKFVRAQTLQVPNSFIFVGRYLRDKGILEFVQAAELLKEKYPQAKFTLLGDVDSNSQSLSAEKIQRLSAAGIISNYGYREDVISALSEHEVFVLPSYREGTPRSALEAMCMAMPLVVADSPGCRETVSNGKNGFVVPVKDVSALADAMEKFIQDETLVETMGTKSREIAIEKYDVEKVVDSILSAVPRLAKLN